MEIDHNDHRYSGELVEGCFVCKISTISFGTGTPVPDGLSKEEAKEIIQCLLDQPNLKVFEITEINPLLDRNNPMEEVMAEILVEVLSIKFQ